MEHPKVGDIYVEKETGVGVRVTVVEIVRLPPPDSFEAAHNDAWTPTVMVHFAPKYLPATPLDKVLPLAVFNHKYFMDQTLFRAANIDSGLFLLLLSSFNDSNGVPESIYHFTFEYVQLWLGSSAAITFGLLVKKNEKGNYCFVDGTDVNQTFEDMKAMS